METSDVGTAEAAPVNPLKRFLLKTFSSTKESTTTFGPTTYTVHPVSGQPMLTRADAEDGALVLLTRDQTLMVSVVIFEAVATMKPRKIEMDINPL